MSVCLMSMYLKYLFLKIVFVVVVVVVVVAAAATSTVVIIFFVASCVPILDDAYVQEVENIEYHPNYTVCETYLNDLLILLLF